MSVHPFLDKPTISIPSDGHCGLAVMQMWEVTLTDEDAAVEVLADLTHHLKPVNVVRFAPVRDILLASADDGQSPLSPGIILNLLSLK